MNNYPEIDDHALIGDLQTAALVATDGTIDWFCAPRFDSPSIFAALLDRDRGGSFRIAPVGTDYVTRQLYLPGTPIVVTRFLSADGVGEVIDFAPIAGETATDRHRLVRMVQVVRGQMRFRLDCEPRFNYGRDTAQIEVTPDGAVFRSPTMTMNVCASRRPNHRLVREEDVRRTEQGMQLVADLAAGDVGGVVLETSPIEPVRVVQPHELRTLFEQTRDFWRSWISQSRYRGRWREMVERSAMTLKLMTYAPTGALVAAPTAGLPEQVGGERNWDYRFTWVRDASFSVYALLGLGFTSEAQAFMKWLGDRVRNATEDSGALQIMYRIDGSPHLEEEVLDHLEGYKGSSPVRIGNAAADQLQLDIYGEALDSLYLADTHDLRMSHKAWRHTTGLVEWLCDHWDRPDDGIWETRGGRQNFVYGRLMSWVAFDRAIRLAQSRGRPANLGRWTEMRDRIYDQIMNQGFHSKREAFVQHYTTDVLDASLLSMPLVGFIAPTDPMWQSTLRAIDDELVSDSLVYRYDPVASPDGLRGSEGTFTICTFWYVDALARSGRLEDARLTFEKMLTYSNHLGLYSEEIAPTGEQIGNFPQAFSHLALITAAMNLNYQLDHGPGYVEPVLGHGLATH
ncbi:glycoside hydrolase family 15 protein [Actinopolymorpha singaporensis]|uniref:Glucoamylase (Glucan-1,4-alpha-glucosidase), GH15 family n=1 Tax=Actinopolymorpha singaporensis TaxID=117157 RepID=A0A1H1U7W9_9ACTN|nr:glycoside hydrolase family 15 protein [Actinopolymorpha singaporensis]SDS67929.1 Glucoamylase (glucan-1,4-alpha-glucosidase), GH15 family [Actinopolymorpha singaporensis]